VALGYDRIEEAPAQNRNYLNFVLIAPGVAPSSGSNTQRSAAGVRVLPMTVVLPLAACEAGTTVFPSMAQTIAMKRLAETVWQCLEMVQEFRVSGTAVGAELEELQAVW